MSVRQAEGYMSVSQAAADRRIWLQVLTARDLRPSILSAQPSRARLALAEAGRRKDASLVSTVTSRLGNGPLEIKERAAVTLGQLGGESSRRGLLRARNDPEPAMRYEIAKALDALGDSSAAVPGLIDGARLNGYGSYEAIRRLRTLGDRRAAAPLYAFAKTPGAAFANEAMFAAALSGSVPAQCELRAWATDEGSWRHRETAARGIRLLAHPSERPLLERLENDDNEYVRRAALGETFRRERTRLLGAEARVPSSKAPAHFKS